MVRRDWSDKGVYDILERLYSEIWVYGIRDFYDPITEYAIPETVSGRIAFTGYIPRKIPKKEDARSIKEEQGFDADDRLVVVTTGGGGDGYPIIDTYLTMIETARDQLPFKSVLITGPFMPQQKRRKVFKRARKLGIPTYHFFRQMEKIMAAADVVVTMGGYNTLCEVLSLGTLTLVIPRETPRLEQSIRAKVFHEQRLVDYIPWNDLSPDHLRRKLLALLEIPEPYRRAISRFRLNGIKRMRERIQAFRCNLP